MSADVTVDPSDPTPPFEQLRSQLEALITTGVLPRDARLAPVRQLAGDLGLAPGTVSRAYRELEAQGLVQTRRGAGTRVCGGFVAEDGDSRLAALTRRFVADARGLGAADDDVIAAVRAALDAG
ncbi:GntR family transcriptional regulator [Agilicoccus flavus]|uniref:GntR family transcriptional regulator n=1 Tax=Agilicoccus flavus TaxID=2775968 RepID=UPI001CF6AFB0|nr:GntR family transcriptional regulator [Agilicoccus flavus]